MTSIKNSRILLIESPYSYGKDSIVVGKYFPLGIGYLAAFLRANNYSVKIFQPADDNNFDEELTAQLNSFQPHAVGISVMTPSFPKAVRLCSLIKHNHRCWTILGGHHVSAVGEDVLQQSPDTDFAVIGEGEHTLLELLQELDKNKPSLHTINGLVWRNSSAHIIRNEPRKLIDDLDQLPFPARDLMDISKFRLHSYIDFGKKSATMITSRGCPFKCMFCSSWLTMGSRYRFRSAANILAEVRELVEGYAIDHIVFEDDTMTLNRDRMAELCEGLMSMPNRPSWYALSRVDTMDTDLAKLMKRAGCRMVAFGIESGSPEVLKKIGKKISLRKAEDAITACKKNGLRTLCTFIVGHPFDTKETIQMTLDAAVALGPTIALFFPLTPYPGTEVFERFLDKSFLPMHIEGWEKFIATNNASEISLTPHYTGDELKRIARTWNRKFYLRPKQLVEMARSISTPSDFFRFARGGIYLLPNFFRN